MRTTGTPTWLGQRVFSVCLFSVAMLTVLCQTQGWAQSRCLANGSESE